MKHFFITGTSSGIGRSTAQLALKNGYNVIGIGRNHTISDPNYQAIQLDLNNLENITSDIFPNITNATSISLINNAGTLGEIKTLEKIDFLSILSVINVNLTACLLLSKLFLEKYGNLRSQKTIINISSGAATSAYASWTTYCSSKAGLEMMTKCLIEEQKNREFPTKLYAIAPGVVDTNMQVQIRNTPKEDFELKPKFQKLFDEKLLFSPEYVGEKLLDVIENQEKYPEAIFRIS